MISKSEQPESDEIVEPGVPAALGLNLNKQLLTIDEYFSC
jgi:hypothetical protein